MTFADIDHPATSPRDLTHDVEYVFDTIDKQRLNRLDNTSGGGSFATYAYDEAGNATSRAEAGGTWSFVYDGYNQQRAATNPIGATESYFYNGPGERFLAVERVGGAVTETRFFFGDTEVKYNAQHEVEGTRATIDLGQPVARVDRAGGTVEVTYLYHSALEHLLVALEDDADLKAGFVYGAFGDVLDEVGTAAPFDRRFNDKHYDGISALSYYGYRYYDPLSLQWTQADPMYRFAPDLAWDDPLRANLYTFTMNNALRLIDPDGLSPKDVHLVFAPRVFSKEVRTEITKQVNEHYKGTGVRAQAYTGSRAPKGVLATKDRVVFVGNSKSDYKGFLTSAGVEEGPALSISNRVANNTDDVTGRANNGGTTNAVVNVEGFDEETAAEAISHETGHTYGLDHLGEKDANGKARERKKYEIMYESVRPRSPIRKKLTPDDKKAVRERIEKDEREQQAE